MRTDIGELRDELQVILGRDSQHHITLHCNMSSHPELIEGGFEIYINSVGQKRELLNRILRRQVEGYARETGLHVVVAKSTTYDGTSGSAGQYVDPFKNPVDNKQVFVDELPKDMQGILYFMTLENLEKMNAIRTLSR